MPKRKHSPKPKTAPIARVVEPNAAGIDIGATEIFVAVPADRDGQPVRCFATFTGELEQIATWLKACGIESVVMESTGVYWIPLYDILEERGLKPCLVNARHMKNVPGRRTDWHECQWIQYLHSVGLLRAAFRPEANVCAVRVLMRHRDELVQIASQHVQHIHKALTQMNLQVHHVLSDITGLTGLAIVDAILEGERDPANLAKLRDARVKADEETIRKSLVGNWRTEHLFTLRQSRDLYRSYQQQIVACDQEIEKYLGEFEPWADPDQKPLPPDTKRNRSGNKRRKRADTGKHVLTSNGGLQSLRCRRNANPRWKRLPYLCSASWGDLSRWPTAAHFAPWLALCPGQRYQWRKSIVERDPQSNEPSWSVVPARRSFAPSQSHADGLLPTPDESKVGSASSHHGYGTQNCRHFLYHAPEASGV